MCALSARAHKTTGSLNKAQVRRLPVVNRDKRLVGIISLGDLGIDGIITDFPDRLRGVMAEKKMALP